MSTAQQPERERVVPHSGSDVTLLARTLEKRSSSLGPRAVDRSKSAAAHALKGLKFISRADGASGWPAVERRFDKLAENGLLHRSKFGKCIGMKELEFAGELFDALARRRNISGDSISKAELLEFWDQISDTSLDSRLQTFFDMVDKDAVGRITEEEIKEIITLSASARKVPNITKQAVESARLIMEKLDPSNLGYVKLYNLKRLRLQVPSQSYELIPPSTEEVRSPTHGPRLRPTAEPNPLRRWYRKAQYFLEDNWQRVWVFLLWLSICAGLFTWKFIQYRRRTVFHVMGYCVCVAKGGAETLKFNMALILLPVCRNTITWVRNHTALGRAVPLDDNLNFHKVIAAGISVGAGLHVTSHLTCDFPRLLHATDAELRRGRLQLPGPLKRLTGFNAFWYSHHLFVVVYSLLIVHGHYLYLTHRWYNKSTWMYLIVPMVMYACERLTRALRSSIRHVKILNVGSTPGTCSRCTYPSPRGSGTRAASTSSSMRSHLAVPV
ncbi:hypothetical protein EJB05_26792, partial [Eragrostis curvula]